MQLTIDIGQLVRNTFTAHIGNITQDGEGNLCADVTVGGMKYLMRELEVISAGFSRIADELGKLEQQYCVDCGTELVPMDGAEPGFIKRRCTKCGEGYAFQVEEQPLGAA